MCCQRKPGRYLPSAAIFVSCTHSFPFAEQLALCDRVGVDKREKNPISQTWGMCFPQSRGLHGLGALLEHPLVPLLLLGSPVEERCSVIHPLLWDPEPVSTTDVPVCLWVCFALCLLLTAARRMFIAEDGMDETSPLQPKLRVLLQSFSPQQQNGICWEQSPGLGLGTGFGTGFGQPGLFLVRGEVTAWGHPGSSVCHMGQPHHTTSCRKRWEQHCFVTAAPGIAQSNTVPLWTFVTG